MAWLIQQPAVRLNDNNKNNNGGSGSTRRDEESSFVLKQLRLVMDPITDPDRAVHHESLSMVQHEAMVMEQLTASPRISNIYGYCGVSLQVQTLYGTVEPTMMQYAQDAKSLVVDYLFSNFPFLPLPQRNGLSAHEKLSLITTMAQAIADMHGFEHGVIINSDLAATQFLYDAEGNIRLNDFNNVAFPDWNPKEKKYCKVRRPPWDGRLYAPEQYAGKPIDKQVDVYTLGNLIYMTLTGRWPLYELLGHNRLKESIINGKRPSIDRRYRQRSYIERRLIKVMERMWADDPADRPEIFEVVQFLKETAKAQRDLVRKRANDQII